MKPVTKLLLIVGLAGCCVGTALAEKQNILIIRGASTHTRYAHNNDEVGRLIQSKLEKSRYAAQFDIKTTLNYPKDLGLVENADLIIFSSDGGEGHALVNKEEPTRHTQHLDGVLEKNKTGLIVIHWATDAPSGGMGQLHPENSEMMMDWIGAVYYWVDRARDPRSSWTWKFPVLEMKVDKSHPIANGLPESFMLEDEYYFNFFTDADGRNPGSDQVTFLHTAFAPSHRSDMENKENWRDQAVYWSFTRKNGGRSVAMTSAHMYHTWANPNFFQTFVNSIFWTLNLEIPREGVDIETPTLKELLSFRDTEIYESAQHFK